VDRPPTEHEYFQCSMQMLRSYLTHVRFSPHGQANLVSLKNSLHLSHWMCAASYNLVNRHHSTVKSHLDMVIRVIRNRVHELKFLKPSRLNQRCDGDELRDFDNACFEAFVTFAQDHFTYLKDNEDLHLVLCVISGLAWTEIEERLVDDEEKEKEDWKEGSTAVEAAEDSQVATPQPLQEEWQNVRRKGRADRRRKNKNSDDREQQNIGSGRNGIMTLEKYNAREMLNEARKKMVSDSTSGVETASTAFAMSEGLQELLALQPNFRPFKQSGDDKENNITLDDVVFVPTPCDICG